MLERRKQKEENSTLKWTCMCFMNMCTVLLCIFIDGVFMRALHEVQAEIYFDQERSTMSLIGCFLSYKRGPIHVGGQ